MYAPFVQKEKHCCAVGIWIQYFFGRQQKSGI